MDDFLGSSHDLSIEDKAEMAVLTRKRIEIAHANLDYQKLVLLYLEDPTDSHKDAVDLFFEVTLAPLMREQTEMVGAGMLRALNIDGLKEMLPMVLMVVKSKINIPLLLASIGVHPGLINDVMELVKDYIEKDNAGQ